MSTNKTFKPENHYRKEIRVSAINFDHCHWFSQKDAKLNSLLRVEGRTYSDESVRRVVTYDTIAWDLTPTELRALSEMLLSAADDLEAHIAQVDCSDSAATNSDQISTTLVVDSMNDDGGSRAGGE